MATKMTKKKMFSAIREMVISNQNMVDFIDHEIELLNRKSSAKRKPTERQIENEKLKSEIMSYLTEADTMKCISELQTEIPSLSELKNQRITHLLSALVESEKLEKEYVKRTPYYSVKK